jgi:exodeoxyribonuclease VII large subunit
LTLAHPARKLLQLSEIAKTLEARLGNAAVRHIETRTQHLAQIARTLNAVSPLATLERGYTILLDRDHGNVIRSIAQVNESTAITARLHDGEVPLHKV